MVFLPFDNYSIKYIRNPNYEICAIITCNWKDRRVGELRFYPDSESYSNLYDNKGEITLVFDINHFNNIIDMIRKERPIYLGLDTDSGYGYITTDLKEPITKNKELH